MKLNSSNQEINKEEQVIGYNKDNANITNDNGKFEVSVFTNCINNNFENINNSAMKNTGNIKEIVNQNVDMESNEKMKEDTKKECYNWRKFYLLHFWKLKKCIENISKRFRKIRESVLNVLFKII